MDLESDSLKTPKTFLYRNFVIFFELSEENAFTSSQSLIVVFLSFIQFQTAHVHAFQLYYIQSGTFLDYVISFFSYFDIFNLLALGDTVYQVIFYVACALAYFYLLSYIMLLFAAKNQIKKNFFRLFFVYFAKYYSWLLFFPSIIMFGSQVLCPNNIFQNLTLQCNGIFPTDDVLNLFLALTGFFSAVFMVQLNSYFNYSTWYIKTDYFSTHYEIFLPVYHTARLISAILMVIPTIDQYFVLFYIAKNLFWGLELLYLLIKYMPFSKYRIQQLFLFFIIMYISNTLAMLLDYLTHNQIYENQSNYLYFAIICFLILENSVFSYFKWKIVDIVKSPELDSETFFALIRKIRIFQYVSSSYEPYHMIYFKGVLSLHIETCKVATCFCKIDKLYDSKKGRELELGKRTGLKGVFAKYLIKNWFEAFLLKSNKDPKPSIWYADFLYNKMKNIHMALTQLALAERKSFSYRDKKKILQFREQIRLYIKEKNSEFCHSMLGFEVIVFLEEQLDKIIVLKRRFLKKSAKFWNSLENSFLNLTEMNKFLSDLMKIKSEITALWQPLKPYLESKKQLRFYYQWYLKNIMNKRLKVADEEIKNDESLEDDDFLSVDSKDLFSDGKNEEKLIFQHDCCVLHVKSTPNSLANIHKANSGALSVFEYTQSEIMGSDLTRIMSPFFAMNHAKYIENFIKNSKTSVLYNMKVAFGLNKSGFIFPLWLVIKQFTDNSGGLEYIAMIKPLKTRKVESDYIILNEFGVIDGVSKGISEQLFLEPEFVKKAKMNILLISPKLVKFFTYEKYLKKDTVKKEELKKKEKEKEKEKEKKKKKQSIAKPDKKKGTVTVAAGGNKDLDNNDKGDSTPKNKFARKKSVNKKAVLNLSNNNLPSMPNNSNSSQIQNIIDSPRTTTKVKLDLNEVIGISAMKDSMHTVHKKSENSDSSNKSSSSDDNSSSSSSQDSNVPGYQTQNIVTFILKLPRNLEKYVTYYHDLLAKKDVSYSTLNSMKLFSKTIKEDGAESKNNNKKAEIPQKSEKNVIKKNPIEAMIKDYQLEESYKKELKAIVLTAEKISKNRYLNIYKIRAMISTQVYGEHNQDVLKVLKILSIQKKVEKFNKHNPPPLLSAISEEMVKSQTNIGYLKAAGDESEKILNLSPTLTNKFFRTRTNTNELSVSNMDDLPKNDSDHMHNESNKNIEDDNNNNNNELDLNRINNNNDNTENNENGGLPSQSKFFIKSFQKTKGSNTENLFLKEDTSKAHKVLPYITKIKWFIRLLFLAIFSMSLFTYFLGPYIEFQSIQNTSDKIYLAKSNELNVLKSYNVLMNFIFIANGFFTNILSPDQIDQYFNVQQNDFTDIYTFLINLDQNPLMNDVIFDSSIFPTQTINYTSSSGSLVDFYQIQNKDLLFLYIEKLNNVYNTTDFSNIQINDPDISFFRQYLVPTIIDLLNNIETNLFNSINTTKNYINNFMLYILIAEVTMLCLTFVILLRYILQVNTSFQSIIEVFTYIENADVRSVKRHFMDMLKTIRSDVKTMNDEDNVTERTAKLSKAGSFAETGKKTNNLDDKNEQQFKKLKKFKVGNFLTNIKKKVLIYYFLFIAVSSCLSVGFYFLVKTVTGQIDVLLVNGQTIIGLINKDSFLLILLKEDMYDPTNYRQNLYGKIEEFLPDYLALQTTLYLPEIAFANFDQLATTYLYTDPCLAYPGLNSSEIDECNTISLGKLSLGMVSFDNYFLTKISNFLLLNTEDTFGTLTANDLYGFDRAIYYCNLFLLDILSVWSQDMANVLANGNKYLTIYLVFMLFALIGAYMVAEGLVVGKLRNTYKHYRGIFNNFMPTELVYKERLIKAKLVISNVVNR